MMIDTKIGVPIEKEVLCCYFKRLVNLFFKILPLRENNEESLVVYMKSLQLELLGCQCFVSMVRNKSDYDADYLTILSILQYLIDNPECKLSEVKREVFRAISVCNRLHARLSSEGA